jgi:hypothetical protein
MLSDEFARPLKPCRRRLAQKVWTSSRTFRPEGSARGQLPQVRRQPEKFYFRSDESVQSGAEAIYIEGRAHAVRQFAAPDLTLLPAIALSPAVLEQ